MLPFIGKAHVACRIGQVLYLSKVARIVEMYAACKLFIVKTPAPPGGRSRAKRIRWIVVIEAQHMCMMMRGRPSSMGDLGDAGDNPSTRAEFLSLIR